MLEVAGTDATEAYEEVGHGEDADKMLKRLYIGELIAASVTVSAGPVSSFIVERKKKKRTAASFQAR